VLCLGEDRPLDAPGGFAEHEQAIPLTQARFTSQPVSASFVVAKGRLAFEHVFADASQMSAIFQFYCLDSLF
jgi:hypothetical protein